MLDQQNGNIVPENHAIIIMLPRMTRIPEEPFLVEVLDAGPVTGGDKKVATELADLPENALAKIASYLPHRNVVFVSRASKNFLDNMIDPLVDKCIEAIQHFARFRCKKFSIGRLFDDFLRLTKLSENEVTSMR